MPMWEIIWEIVKAATMIFAILFAGTLLFAGVVFLTTGELSSGCGTAKSIRKSCPPNSNSAAPRKK